MILASLLAIVFGVLITLVSARCLYGFSFKRGLLKTRKDYIVNAIIVAFVFFCASSFLYLIFLNW